MKKALAALCAEKTHAVQVVYSAYTGLLRKNVALCQLQYYSVLRYPPAKKARTNGHANGTDGRTDGQDGRTDGQEGQDGTDGTDGRTDGTDGQEGQDGRTGRTDGRTDGRPRRPGRTDGTELLSPGPV